MRIRLWLLVLLSSLAALPAGAQETRGNISGTVKDAQGALLAAEWLIGKKPGLYGMNDVLGL